MANWRNIISLLLLTTILNACYDNYVSSVPTMPVNLKIDFTGKYNNFKNSTYSFLVFEKPVYEADRLGFAGILLFSGMLDDNGNPTYYAFDMACTHEINQNSKVYPIEQTGFKVKCNTCGTVYDVSFGLGIPDTTSGPAREILRRYKVTVNDNFLYVYR